MHPDADRISIASGLKVKYRGGFDLGDFYKKIKIWLETEGYGDENKNFKEAKYIEAIKPFGKNIDIKWIAEKNISDYFSIYFTVVFRIIGLQDTEVPYENKKIKSNKGEIEVRLSADLITNRQGKWSRNSFMKNIYEKVIIDKRIEEYKLQTYKKIYSLHDELKMYLNLPRY